jgi:hypothetical protein
MGVSEKIDPGAAWRKILSPPGRWTEFARDGQVSWSPGPPPPLWKCGNRASLVLARFPSAGGSVEKAGGKFRSAAGCRSDFSTLSTARHFHSDTLTVPPSPGRSGAPPEKAEVLVAGTKDSRESFSQEVKS